MFRPALCAAAAAALLLPPRLPAQTAFEGVVTYRMAAMGQDATLRYMVKGTRIRQEIEAPQMPGPMFMLMDVDGKVVRTVMPSMGMYMEINLDDMERYLTDDQRKAAEDVTIEKLGTTDRIAGIPCENYRMGAPAEMEICVATGMGWFMSAPAPGRGRGAGAPNLAKFREQFKDGMLPLRMTHVKNGTREVMMEATSVERKALDDSLFQLPTGLRKMDMPGGE